MVCGMRPARDRERLEANKRGPCLLADASALMVLSSDSPSTIRGSVKAPLSTAIEPGEVAANGRDRFGYTKADRRGASNDARVMGLRGRAVSPEARRVASTLMDGILPPVRPTSRPGLLVAVEATISDLLVAARAGQWTRRSLMAPSFTGEAVTRRMFKKVRESFEDRQFIESIPGHYERGGLVASGRQTLFRPTAALLELAASHGVMLDTLPEHFSIERPVPPPSTDLLVLRASKPLKVDGRRRAAAELSIAPNDPGALRLVEELEGINAFLSSIPIEGFAFSGLRRIFNNGDQPEFAWQRGGRFYSLPGGDDYMRWKGGKAARADAIRLQGEKVGEVDLSASHLTILYGLLGEPFDHTADPTLFPAKPARR